MFKLVFVLLIALLWETEAARILAHYPFPSFSHQSVFKTLTLELLKHGHEVVVLTTDPTLPNGDVPANLTEIDLHFSYTTYKTFLAKINNKFSPDTYNEFTKIMLTVFDEQMKSDGVQKILKDKPVFDLIIAEAIIPYILGWSHIFKNVPVIQFSSAGATMDSYIAFGSPIHPIVYPTVFHDKIYNLSLREKVYEFINDYKYINAYKRNEDMIAKVMTQHFGADTPKLEKLATYSDMLFLNIHSFWDFNRPVPPNVIYLGGFHQKPRKSLPKDLQTYLDSSKNGVIYVSFGTNVDPALFPPEKVQTLVNAFSKLPYDVLWKWNKDELPGRTANIRISKWLPQSDLLRHPKIKLFVTQGGLQSTDEAITAGVPLIGIPIFADQKFNVEQYIYHGIGVRVEIETVTEEKLSNAINTIIRDDSYRKNAAKLRTIITDQPQTPLERAVWWTEYVIRHKGAKHLRSPAANMSMAEYFELELISYILLALFLALAAVVLVVRFLYKLVFRRETKLKKT